MDIKTTKCCMLALSGSRCAEEHGHCVDPTTCPCNHGRFKSYQCDAANPSHRCCSPRSKTLISNWEPCQPRGMYTVDHNLFMNLLVTYPSIKRTEPCAFSPITLY